MSIKSSGILRNQNLELLNNVWMVLAVLCLLGGIVRLYHLDSQSLWYDEFASIRYANLPFFESLTAETNHPPLHDFLLWVWIRLFGNNEFSVRSLSVLFGLATIIPLALLGKELFDFKTGLIAGALITLSPFHIYFSQEARMYSMVVFFTAGSSLFFLRYLASKNYLHYWLYVLTTLLGFYTFYLFGFVILAQNLYFFCRKPPKDILYRWILGQALIFLFFLPWLIYFLTHLRNQGRDFSENFLWRIPYMFYTFSMGYSGFLLNYFEKMNLLQTIKNNILVIGLTMIIFGFISIRGVYKMFQKENKWAGIFIAMHLFIPIILLMVLWKIIPLLSERYLSFISVYYYILLAIGISSFQGYWVRTILLFSIFLLTAYSLKIYYFEPKFGKEQWRDVAQQVQNSTSDSDVILFHKDYIAGIFNYYYKENRPELGIPEHAMPNQSSELIEVREIWKEGIYTRFGERKSYRLSNPEIMSNNSPIRDLLFTSRFSQYRRIWFIEAKNYDTDNFYSKLLNKYFVQVNHQIYPKMNGINLYLYELPTTP